MAKIKQYWAITGVAIVALLGAGYFFGVKPQSAKTASVKAETATQSAANSKLRTEIAILEKQSAGVVAQQARLRQIAGILPSTTALPRLIRSVSAHGKASGVNLTGMSPGTITPVVDSTVKAPAPAPSASASAPAEGEAAAAPKKAPAVAPLYGMPVTLALTGDFAHMQLFLAKVEKLDRAAVIESITVAPAPVDALKAAPKTNELSITMVARVFIKPAPVAAAPVKAPAVATAEK